MVGISLLYFFMSACDTEEVKNDTKEPYVSGAYEIWSDTIIKSKYEDGSRYLVWGYKPNDDKMHYEWKYYQNGKLWLEGPMYDTLRHGKWQGYNEYGNLQAKGTYKLGKATGIYTVWHDNGVKYYEGNMIDGQRLGEWVFYDNEFNKLKVIDYSKKDTIE